MATRQHFRMTGIVTVCQPDTGVIKGNDGLLYVFHRNDAPSFAELRAGVAVFFSPWGGAKGPRAKEIHIDRRLDLVRAT